MPLSDTVRRTMSSETGSAMLTFGDQVGIVRADYRDAITAARNPNIEFGVLMLTAYLTSAIVNDFDTAGFSQVLPETSEVASTHPDHTLFKKYS